MKLGLMPGTPPAEMRELGFHAVQQFYAGNCQIDDKDPTDEAIRATLTPGDIALAAMTLHIDLVNPQGLVQADADRAMRLVSRTAAFKDVIGDAPRPIMVWHPSGYPDSTTDDNAVFKGLVIALRQICTTAEKVGVDVAIEMTRAGSIGSAETFLRLKDHVASPALRVCLDAANIVTDRTPLIRCVRMLADDIVLAHGKDSHFNPDGSVAGYGPTGSGKLDYATYIGALKDFCDIPYFILEYYQDRAAILRARDIVLQYL
jgi:sugar phosphate isomerase/epimerase